VLFRSKRLVKRITSIIINSQNFIGKMSTDSVQSIDDVVPAEPTVVKRQIDEESLSLLRLRLSQLEAESMSNTQSTNLTNNHLFVKREKFQNRKLVQMAMMEGYIGCKALPSQYEHKADTTHDKTADAVRHHTSSHYHMAGGVQFQRGVRVKGVVSRHSKQAAIRNGKKSKANKQKSATSLGMLGKA